MNRLIRLNPRDNVAVALTDLRAGEVVSAFGRDILLREDIRAGHKVALTKVAPGVHVIKYGFPIGVAGRQVEAGQWVHTHNLESGLGGIKEYAYHPLPQMAAAPVECATFRGFRRPDGQVGVRNEVWVIPTVGCVNSLGENLIRAATRELGDMAGIDGFHVLRHPLGCSQLGDDHLHTQRVLAALAHHPNAGGVLILGLGCENNNITSFRPYLGEADPRRVRFLVSQEVEDELALGVELLEELAAYAGGCRREECSLADLKLGLKCGGSDAFSGITANPLAGLVADRVTDCGGAAVLTEVPEMFGAETILMDRARDEAVFGRIVGLINDWKEYYRAHGQPVYENPSPGNKEGGLTTLEEKSLGCIQKGGRAPVVDVLPYGGRCRSPGLNLLSAPGNDLVSSTALAAAGCQVVLFTSGRGTPLGTCVPTLKIASNAAIYSRKTHWFDFDAGRILGGENPVELAKELLGLIIEVASGRLTKAERLGSKEIAIFKSGVTL